MKQPVKQYIAQVYMMDKSGNSFEFISAVGSHKRRIESIRKGRSIIEEKVRFIEKLPQDIWSYSDLKPLSKEV